MEKCTRTRTYMRTKTGECQKRGQTNALKWGEQRDASEPGHIQKCSKHRTNTEVSWNGANGEVDEKWSKYRSASEIDEVCMHQKQDKVTQG